MREKALLQQVTGTQGEDAAVAYLEKKQYTILARNYRTKRGEIDIVSLDEGPENGNKQLVFVEVKARRDLQYGVPIEAITEEKMGRIQQAAEVYLMQHNLEEVNCRFDVVGILFTPEGVQIEHIEDVLDY